MFSMILTFNTIEGQLFLHFKSPFREIIPDPVIHYYFIHQSEIPSL